MRKQPAPRPLGNVTAVVIAAVVSTVIVYLLLGWLGAKDPAGRATVAGVVAAILVERRCRRLASRVATGGTSVTDA